MKFIGLTGGIATGKSLVAQIISEKNIPIIYADKLAHEALDKGSVKMPELKMAFGDQILVDDGSVDRRILGNIIFNDPIKKKELEGIIHPYVRSRLIEEKKKHQDRGAYLCVYEVPLLFEKNMQEIFDQTLLVVTSKHLQLKRLMSRNGFIIEEAQRRVAAQMPQEEKKILADYVIANEGSKEELVERVELWLKVITERYSLPR